MSDMCHTLLQIMTYMSGNRLKALTAKKAKTSGSFIPVSIKFINKS